MSGEQYTLLGLPVSFFFLLLLLTVIGFLILTFFLRYICSKYKCCSFRSEGTSIGEDAVEQDENEKPPSYDEAMQADPSYFPSTQDFFTVLPKYCDVVGHCCGIGSNTFLSNESGGSLSNESGGSPGQLDGTTYQWTPPSSQENSFEFKR